MANAWIRMKHRELRHLRRMLDVVGRTVKVRRVTVIAGADARRAGIVLLGAAAASIAGRLLGRSRPMTSGHAREHRRDRSRRAHHRRLAGARGRRRGAGRGTSAAGREPARSTRAPRRSSARTRSWRARLQGAPGAAPPPAGLLPRRASSTPSMPRGSSRCATSSPSSSSRSGRSRSSSSASSTAITSSAAARSTRSSTSAGGPASATSSPGTAASSRRSSSRRRRVVIAGGHVASLLNRLQLFDVDGPGRGQARSSRGRPARWCSPSASCSSTTPRRRARRSPRCSTPASASCPALVVLPDPRRRLRLDDSGRASRRFARRFAPADLRARWTTGAQRRLRRAAARPTRSAERLDRRPATSSAAGRGAVLMKPPARHRATARGRAATPRGGRRVPRRPTRSRSSRGRASPSSGAARPTPCTSSTGSSACRRRSRSPRVEGTDLWYLTLDLPPGSRVEYKLEIVRGGHGEWIEDPLNPNRARDPFGANSVVHGEGYEVPEWMRPDPDARPGTPGRALRSTSTTFGRRGFGIYLPARFRRTRRYPLLVVHDGSDYLQLRVAGARARQPDRTGSRSRT